MVKRSTLLLSLGLAVLTHASPLAAREYQLGDRAAEDLKTPIALDVINTEATEALREKESRRVPVVYRYSTHAVDEVEAAFHSTFVRTRTNFLEAVQTRFMRPVLTAEDVTSTDFQRLVAQFQKQNILFPLGPNLARIWAKGESDQEIESPLIARLRKVMSSYVRNDTVVTDIWVGSTIRLVPMEDNETATARLINERGVNIPKTNFVSIQRCKTDLANSFPAEEHSVARYLASFIKPNCAMEAALTRELRNQRADGLSITDHYLPGQILLKRGQVVDQKALAALDQLKEKTAVTKLQQLEPSAKFTENQFPLWWIAAGAGIAAVVFCFMLWKAAQRRAKASLLPALSHINFQASPAETAFSNDGWRERALAAEQRAERAQAVVRSGLVGHLAQWMAARMTRKMLAEREQLLDTHDRAASEVAELEARLEKVQAPLQERLQAYERRIADLEKELTLKGEENRELIRAKIQIIRKQLEIERERNRVEFN